MKKPTTYMYAVHNALKDETVFCNRRPRKAELHKLAKSEFMWDDERFKEEWSGFNLVIKRIKVHTLTKK